MTTEYPKIETLFNRNPEDMKHVIVGQLRDPAFGLVDKWLVTEKIDGTNVRIIYENGEVRIGGKTDNASMPLFLLDVLNAAFTAERFDEIWPTADAPGDLGDIVPPRVVLYGEGYGPRIQKGGGNYRSDPAFRLFDVRVWGDDSRGGGKWWWLDWPNVEDVANKLGIATVPVLAENATLDYAAEFVNTRSVVASLESASIIDHEGIVCRTVPLLFNRRGHRVMWKLKGRDLA